MINEKSFIFKVFLFILALSFTSIPFDSLLLIWKVNLSFILEAEVNDDKGKVLSSI